ncbi:hypothetical protein SADUNF_Sadunf14G0096000 [Salix dunnii]|uniref:Uncharacterized protein n=1 Tax=Salix dunnii TaxID=1413687 RepID=A0A835JLL4_9ROSI|nr:hypothetical protein SADUNF_Sadunf14G0096000 [Salix dunnii]
MIKERRVVEGEEGERNGNPELGKEREMEEELMGAVPCSSLAVDSILRVGKAGAIWGSCIGPYDARKRGLTGVTQASFVVEMQSDLDGSVNPLIAGAVAGATVAAGTRSWTQVVGMAGLVSAFSVAADYSKTF